MLSLDKPKCQCLPEGGFTHFWWPGFTQKMLLDCLALEMVVGVLWSPLGLVTIRETVLGRLAPPGHCTDYRMKHCSDFL